MSGTEQSDREEAFIAWRADPVTKQVMEALSKMGARCKEKWFTESWGAGKADPILLADLRARYEAVEDMTQLTFEELEEALAEPERD